MATQDRATDGGDERSTIAVLLVDDDPNQREMYQRRLGRKGYHIELAHSADSAVEALKQRRPDVIILDIAMPGRDGLSALQEFLDVDPSVPVIINTAYPAYAENFLSWAADAYIEKSSDLEPLIKAIEQAVTRARA
ncbi:MAG: response regulator [Armatimonadota bacterium]